MSTMETFTMEQVEAMKAEWEAETERRTAAVAASARKLTEAKFQEPLTRQTDEVEGLTNRVAELEAQLGEERRSRRIQDAIAREAPGLPSAYRTQVMQDLNAADELTDDLVAETVNRARDQMQRDFEQAGLRPKPTSAGGPASPPASPRDDEYSHDAELAELDARASAGDATAWLKLQRRLGMGA